jgi:hypothetical protein
MAALAAIRGQLRPSRAAPLVGRESLDVDTDGRI